MIAISLLLTLVVGVLWLAAWGFARLRSSFDRIHAVSFAGVAVVLPLAAAVFVADGASDRALKVLLLGALMLGSSAALSHATARAIAVRRSGGERR